MWKSQSKELLYIAESPQHLTMKVIYQLRADELDQSFLDALKAAFKDKQIEIAVYERDETVYLLRSPANRDRLLRAIADVEKLQSIVASKYEKFQ